MLIEQIWPYLPTPVIYAVIIAVALVALFSANHAIMAMTFLWVIAIAFVASTWTISRPFHLERLAIMLTLAIAHASLFAVNLQEVYEFLHLHDEDSMMLARVVYSIIWLLVTGASLFSYAHNTGRGVARVWPAIAIITLLAAVFPIEPDAFIVTQPAWTWLLRLHAAFALFLIVALGDSASILAAMYRDRVDSHRRGHRVKEPSQLDMDISLVRTLLWSPMVLWVMFVPRIFLIVLIPLGVYLIRVAHQRWGMATLAHSNFVHTLTAPEDGLNLPVETIVDVISTLNSDELDYVMTRTLGVPIHGVPLQGNNNDNSSKSIDTRPATEKRRHRHYREPSDDDRNEKRRKKKTDNLYTNNVSPYTASAIEAVNDM